MTFGIKCPFYENIKKVKCRGDGYKDRKMLYSAVVTRATFLLRLFV